MTDEKINSTANNIQINIDNLSYVDYLWTQRISDTAIQGVRLDQRNLPLNLNADTVDNKHASDFASASHTHNYAGSESAGGAANSVKGALTFGAKTYNGSTSQEITLSDLGGNIINCYDTSTDDTAGTWTVSIPNVTELTEGLTIKIRLKTSYNGTINTLNVNGLGAKTIYFRYGNKLTSHYSKESILALTYTSNAISSGTDRSGWIIENIYDSTNTFQLRKYYTRYKTKSALYRYMICFVNKDDELIPANNVSNSTATTKTLTTESFMPSKGIYYYNSTTTIAAASYTGNATLYQQLGLIDLRYSFNTGTTLTANKPVYLVVTAQTDGQVKLASTPIAQTLPTSDTDNLYVFLGTAYDNYRIELTIEHPIYVYRNGYCESLDMSHDRVLDSISSMAHTHSNKSILDNTTASFTTDDKTKLDGIETGANKTIVDTLISSTSTNPVQNKAISSALGFKANLSNGNYFVGDQSIIGALNITAASGAGQITIKGTTGYHPGGVTLQTTGTSETKATTVTIPAKTGTMALLSEIPTKSSWNYDDTYVKYSASQTLTDTQKSQARTNIGAGTSNFTGYTSSNKLHTDYINNAAGWTSNKGTVTSVQVQAGTGLSSSQSTAQTNTLDTTISIASGYKLPTTTEWSEIPSINDAYSISAGNGIILTPSASSLEISVNSTSSVTSDSTALVTSGAVYSAIQSAITTALNTPV